MGGRLWAGVVLDEVAVREWNRAEITFAEGCRVV